MSPDLQDPTVTRVLGSKWSGVRPTRLRYHEKDRTTVQSSTKPLASTAAHNARTEPSFHFTRHASPILSQSKAQLSTAARSANDWQVVWASKHFPEGESPSGNTETPRNVPVVLENRLQVKEGKHGELLPQSLKKANCAPSVVRLGV